MLSFDNNFSISTQIYLDYDLVSLSNTLIHSFEEGIRLASFMLNAPFFITNLYDYIVIQSELPEVDDPAWKAISETHFCDPAIVSTNANIYSASVPHIGKIIYYSTVEPTNRQKQLAIYLAWTIAQFGEEKFYISDSNSNPKNAFLFYLVNKQYSLINQHFHNFLTEKLSKKMQLLSCFRNVVSDSFLSEIAALCNHTEFTTIYKQKYWILLFSELQDEQLEILSKFLLQHNIYAGLSYPFSDYKEGYNHTLQAVTVLNEAAKGNHKNHLALYEDLFAFDIFYNYSSDIPLSHFRHPLFSFLEEYDKNDDSGLYITLITYIKSSGNTKETAKQLSMHRNTVLYRLGKITELTGYDVQDPSCRSSLLYALTIEQSLKKSKS